MSSDLKIARYWPWAVLAGLIGLISWSAHRYTGFIDEGLILSSAQRVAHGQVMYRDFFEFWSPGTVYLLALAFKLFGQTWLVVRVIHAVVISLILVLGYTLLRQIGLSAKLAFIPVVIFALIPFFTPQLSHHWLGWVGLLAAIHLLLQSSNRSSRWLLAAGIMAGVSAWFMQYEGAAAIFGGGVWLVTQPQPKRYARLGWFSLGVFMVWLPVGYYFASHGAASQALYDIFLFPLAGYRQANGQLPDFFWLTQTVLLTVSYTYLYKTNQINTQLKLIWYTAIVLQVASGLTSGNHAVLTSLLAHGLMLKTISVKYHLISIKRIKEGMSKLFIQSSLRFIVTWLLLLGAIIDLASSIFLPILPAHAFFNATQTVSTAAGPVQTTPSQAKQITAIARFITTHLTPDQTLYIGPYASIYYFFNDRLNPTAFSQVTPNYNSPAMIQAAIEQIDQVSSPYLIFLPHQVPFQVKSDNLFYRYISTNYHPYLFLTDIRNSPIITDLPDAIWIRNSAISP